MRLLPWFEGGRRVGAGPDDVREAFTARVRAGLVPNAPATRNRYRITAEGPGQVVVESASALTSWFVGLNRIRLTLEPDAGGTRLRYRVEFRAWLRYAFLLGSVFIVLALALVLALPHLPAWTTGRTVERIGTGWATALIVSQGVFWGLVWPWALSAFHGPRARRLFERILDETAGARTA